MAWGGKRENSGRKPVIEKVKPCSVYLTEGEKIILDTINKNRTEAVRILIKNYINLKK